MKKFTGKEIQDQFCKIGINALWIKNLGMIFMPNSYGTDTAAAESDTKCVNAIASAACAKLLPQISEARATGDDDPLQLGCTGAKQTARTKSAN